MGAFALLWATGKENLNNKSLQSSENIITNNNKLDNKRMS